MYEYEKGDIWEAIETVEAKLDMLATTLQKLVAENKQIRAEIYLIQADLKRDNDDR